LYDEYMSPDDIREEIELQIVDLLKEKLATGEMTDSRAQQISERTLTILVPGMSFEKLYRAIGALDDTMTELSPVILPYIKEYEENVTGQALSSVRELIKQGQYDAAAKLGVKAAGSDVELQWSGSSSAGAGSAKPEFSFARPGLAKLVLCKPPKS
jgi:hypothetical protein